MSQLRSRHEITIGLDKGHLLCFTIVYKNLVSEKFKLFFPIYISYSNQRNGSIIRMRNSRHCKYGISMELYGFCATKASHQGGSLGSHVTWPSSWIKWRRMPYISMATMPVTMTTGAVTMATTAWMVTIGEVNMPPPLCGGVASTDRGALPEYAKFLQKFQRVPETFKYFKNFFYCR